MILTSTIPLPISFIPALPQLPTVRPRRNPTQMNQVIYPLPLHTQVMAISALEIPGPQTQSGPYCHLGIIGHGSSHVPLPGSVTAVSSNF